MRASANAIVALTGAGSGIGRALAVALHARGASLALADQNEGGLEETRALLSGPAPVSTHVLDVSSRVAVDDFAHSVLGAHGRIDVVINNAGVAMAGTVAELTADEMAWVMNVNFWGVVHGTKAFLPAMLEQRSGTIVNVSSVFGLWGPPNNSIYAASKLAVRGFTESLRAEVNGRGIHVMTVHPAGIKTAIARRSRIAAAADQAQAHRMMASFDRNLLTIAPQVAAAKIIAGIDKKHDRVLIGSDAFRIDRIMRIFGPRGSRMLSDAVLRSTKKVR
ncbi:MAG: SDR family NAD(P)-dependent oxidoreductase [Candidatus Velthaea sp.]